MTDYVKSQKIVHSRVSWSKHFANAVIRRKSIERALNNGNPYAAAYQLFGTGVGVLTPKTVTQRERLESEVANAISGHAPWLNGDAIAHRRGVGSKAINGFYYM